MLEKVREMVDLERKRYLILVALKAMRKMMDAAQTLVEHTENVELLAVICEWMREVQDVSRGSQLGQLIADARRPK